MKFSVPVLVAMLALPAVVAGKKKKDKSKKEEGKGKGGYHAPGDEDCACRGQVSYEMVEAPPRTPCIMPSNQFLLTPFGRRLSEKKNSDENQEHENNEARRLDGGGYLTFEAWQEYLNASPEFENCVLAPVTSKDDLEYYDYLNDYGYPAILGVFKDIREAQECWASTEPGDSKVDDDCFDDWKNTDSSAGGVPCDEDLWDQNLEFKDGERNPQPDGVSDHYGDLATVGVLSGNGPVMFDEAADDGWYQAVVKCCNNKFSKCLNEPPQDDTTAMMMSYMIMMMHDHGDDYSDCEDNSSCEEDDDEYRRIMVQVLYYNGLSTEWLKKGEIRDLPICGEYHRTQTTKNNKSSGKLATGKAQQPFLNQDILTAAPP